MPCAGRDAGARRGLGRPRGRALPLRVARLPRRRDRTTPGPRHDPGPHWAHRGRRHPAHPREGAPGRAERRRLLLGGARWRDEVHVDPVGGGKREEPDELGRPAQPGEARGRRCGQHELGDLVLRGEVDDRRGDVVRGELGRRRPDVAPPPAGEPRAARRAATCAHPLRRAPPRAWSSGASRCGPRDGPRPRRPAPRSPSPSPARSSPRRGSRCAREGTRAGPPRPRRRRSGARARAARRGSAS